MTSVPRFSPRPRRPRRTARPPRPACRAPSGSAPRPPRRPPSASATTLAAPRISSVRLARRARSGRGRPFFRFSAIGRPMMPRPINPIFMSVSGSPSTAGSLPAFRRRIRSRQPSPATVSPAGRYSQPTQPPIAELVHPAEHVGPADLAGAGLVARRHVGDLHVRDHRHELLHALGDVALGRSGSGRRRTAARAGRARSPRRSPRPAPGCSGNSPACRGG